MRKAAAMRDIRCYLCGYRLTVSMRAMSTSCPGCRKAIKIEDVVVKTYIPVIDLQTCGRIRITKRGRVAARRIQSGEGITCDGVMEGAVETDGDVHLGPKASWKGSTLLSRSIKIDAGAKMVGVVTVPWHRPEPVEEKKTTEGTTARRHEGTKKATTKKTVARKTTAKKPGLKKTAAKKKTVSKKKTVGKKKR